MQMQNDRRNRLSHQSDPMRIAVHDFGGYAFPFQLSRELADRGHSVVHFYPPDLPGPHRLATKAENGSFTIHPIALPHTFRKYSPASRLLAHREYAAGLIAAIRAAQCNVVLSGNTPIDIQYQLLNQCLRSSIPLVHWIQDIYCLAVRAVLSNKFGSLGRILAGPFATLERRVAERSAGVICITDDFKSYLAGRSIHPKRLWVIENWTPLNEVTPLPKVNAWSQRAGLARKTVFLYSGTMGIKHNPKLIYDLARSFDKRCDVVCGVVSEGLGRNYLEQKPKTASLRLFDFQPYSCLPEVLATADVLVAVIEPEASRFSVPSKVLTYMAAGRPVLLASPAENLAARIVRMADAGIVVDPGDTDAFIRAAHHLLKDRELCRRFSTNARKYAEAHFQVRPIADAFEKAICEVTGETAVSNVGMLANGSPVIAASSEI
jgi:colanic acid biosynthesis glycosyl transferase WcaI